MQVCKKMADSVLHVSIAGKIDTVTAPALDSFWKTAARRNSWCLISVR